MTWGDQQGSALVLTLGVIGCLAGLGLGILSAALTERTIAARTRDAAAAASAAGAIVEFGCAEFGALGDWSGALAGTRASVFQDGGPVALTPTRTVIDLESARGALQQDTRALYPVGADVPVWRLWAWGPLARLAGLDPAVTRAYVALWVADDPADADGRPAQDANGAIMLHGEAFGDGATRRAIDAVIARGEGAVRLLSWRVS